MCRPWRIEYEGALYHLLSRGNERSDIFMSDKGCLCLWPKSTQVVIDIIHIREADSHESSLLSHLIRKAYREVAERFNLTPENCPKHPSNCSDEWIENDFKRGVVYYILELDDAPIGCAALEKADPDHCYLERLAVTPPHRNNGFGKALVDHVLAQARVFKMKSVGIGIISEQVDLKSWYRKIGFVEKEPKRFPLICLGKNKGGFNC
jgi:GNAT superfamily N-acetyltransferase